MEVSRNSRQRGFTIAEIIVAMGVVAILLATMVLTGKSRIASAEAEALVSTMDAYRTAVGNFRTHVGRYPTTSAQLAAAPGSTGPPLVSNQDICAQTLTAAQIAAWRGPYLAQQLSTDGLQVGGSVVENPFTRDPVAITGVGDLVISVTPVDGDVAKDVEEAVDGKPVDYNAGVVRYTSPTLTYRVRVVAC